MNDKLIGIIGLGNMGYHFATRLIEYGYNVIVYDLNKDVLKEFKDKGSKISNSPKEIGDYAEIVILSLPSAKVVKEVVLNKSFGLIHGKKICTYIDLSTTGKEMAEYISLKLSKKNIEVLDSPVSGGVSGAKNGQLAVMTSGNKDTYEKCLPILKIVGNNTFYVGEIPGQGQAMKIINNLLSFASLAITSESVTLATKAGLDSKKTIEILNMNSGRNSATQDKFPKAVLNRGFNFGFKHSLAYKDIKMYQELAEYTNTPIFLASNLITFWKFVNSQTEVDTDFTSIVKHFEKWAKITISES